MTQLLGLVVLLVLTFLCADWSGQLAERRGRSRKTWFLLGLLFAPIPLIVIALLPRSHKETVA